MSAPPEERALQTLAALARRNLHGQAAHRGQRTFERIQETLDEREQAAPFRRRRARPARMLAFGAPALALAAALGLYLTRGASGALDYEVSGAVAMASGDVVGGERSRLLFTDGSELTLERGARARVASLDAHGGQIVLASGKAHLAIQKRPASKWYVHAGPYRVRVTGTAFDVRWSASERTFELAMEHGEVYVTGPLLDGAVRLRGGQRVRASLIAERVWIGEGEAPPLEAAPSADGAPAKDSPRAAEVVGEAPQQRAAGGRKARHGKGPWAQRVTRGDFRFVVEDARRRGIASVLSAAPLGELSALADAARFVRDHDLARRALLSARQRFPGSAVASDAAFLLGRLEERAAGGDAGKRALQWYGRYLRESPRGPYADKARGRRMLEVYRTQGRKAAAELARDYLQRHPRGPYADTAQRVLDGQPSEASPVGR